MTAQSYTLQALAEMLGLPADAVSDPACRIAGLASLEQAGPVQLSFYSNVRYRTALIGTRAGAVVLRPEHAADCPVPTLRVQNPYAVYAHITQLFAADIDVGSGIHPSAQVADTAKLGRGVAIGPHVVIGANATIGDRVRIEANCVIGAACAIGDDSRLHPNVTLYHGVRLGARATVHSSAVIGGEGFGFAPDRGSYVKIAHLGGVDIGDDVEIGACTTIDRGALEDTRIGNGVKIDNLVQIAHNVQVGDNTIICGCSGLAGSCVVGKNCIIAGGVGIADHVMVCDGVTFTGMTLVNQSVSTPGVYSSGTALSDSATWRKNIVRFRQLDEIWKRLLRLEKKR